MDELNGLIDQVHALKALLVQRATGGFADNGDYIRLRGQLLSAPGLARYLPPFVRRCRDLTEFWDFIKPAIGTWAGRREYLREQFDPLLAHLEAAKSAPSDSVVSSRLGPLDAQHVQAAWARALERRHEDPDGAITAARSLVESVCKYVLDREGVTYEDQADLPKLYGAAADVLQLAPSQHAERDFKRILGGCQSVIEGLAGLRNRMGDAHGKGSAGVRASPRHAALAVNLAGAMAEFLLDTYDTRVTQQAREG